MFMEQSGIYNPYKGCEKYCNHDLIRGVLVTDLLEGDGPYQPLSRIITLPSRGRFVWPLFAAIGGGPSIEAQISEELLSESESIKALGETATGAA